MEHDHAGGDFHDAPGDAAAHRLGEPVRDGERHALRADHAAARKPAAGRREVSLLACAWATAVPPPTSPAHRIEIAIPLRSADTIRPAWAPTSDSTAPFSLLSTIALAPPPSAAP